MEHIEDKAMDKAHGKLGWYCKRYQEVNKNKKSLQEQLNAEKEHLCKAKSEIHLLQKEEKTKGKQRESLLHAISMNGSPPWTLILL